MNERKAPRTDSSGATGPRLTRRTFLSFFLGAGIASLFARQTPGRAKEKEALFWRKLP